MSRIEGIDPDECDTLRDGLAETDSFIDETRREAVEEAQKDDPDEAKIQRLSREMEDARHVRDRLEKATGTGCGLKFFPTGEEDVGTLECDDVEELHETLDDAENDVADSMPEWIVEDDIGFQEEADLQVKQKAFTSHASKAKDALEDFAETRGCDVPDERNDRSPAGSMVIECGNHPTEEGRQECRKRRMDGDTNFTLDPRQYG